MEPACRRPVPSRSARLCWRLTGSPEDNVDTPIKDTEPARYHRSDLKFPSSAVTARRTLMSDLALPYVLPRINNPNLEFVKYSNLLKAFQARRSRTARVDAFPIDLTIDLTT